jgi:hypothetical protein
MLQSLSYYYSKDILEELRAEAPDNGSPMWPPLALLIWDLKGNFKAGDKRKVVWPCVLRGITPGESDRKRALVAWDKEVVLKLKATQRVPATTASVVELKEWNRECESVAFNTLDSTMRAQLFDASLPTEEKAPWGKLNLLSVWLAHLQVLDAKVTIPA